MITRPSMTELLEGLTLTLEAMQAGQYAHPESQAIPMLGVIDRLNSEWSSWQVLLLEDNLDLRDTLTDLNHSVPNTPETDHGSHRVAALEEENRSLKSSLDQLILQYDLPADANASADVVAADEAVKAFLSRSLHRNHRVDVAPPRVAPTSGNAAGASISLADLEATLLKYIQAEMRDASQVTIRGLDQLTGGASREAWVFDLSWQANGALRTEACILMREPISSVLVSDASDTEFNGTRRTMRNEVETIRTMQQQGVKVADILFLETTGQWLDRPFSIARRLPGTADVSEVLASPEAETLLEEFIDLLSQIHRIDPLTNGFEFLGKPTHETAARIQVDLFEQNFKAQALEPFPAITYMVQWLKKNAPKADRLSVIHGDYRLGNFLWHEGHITAVLDWEQVHLGDPLEEIAFMYWPLWTLEPVCPIETFITRYGEKMGMPVDRTSLAYYRVFIELKMLVVVLTGAASFYATKERQLHYGSSTTNALIRESELRAIESILQGGPTVAFDAYPAS